MNFQNLIDSAQRIEFEYPNRGPFQLEAPFLATPTLFRPFSCWEFHQNKLPCPPSFPFLIIFVDRRNPFAVFFASKFCAHELPWYPRHFTMRQVVFANQNSRLSIASKRKFSNFALSCCCSCDKQLYYGKRLLFPRCCKLALQEIFKVVQITASLLTHNAFTTI